MYKYFYSLLFLLLCCSTISATENSEGWKLDLYYRVDCPYCQKVIRYFNHNGIAIGLKDIQRDDDSLEELRSLTGRTTVPCLFINGTTLFESDAIIEWFEDNITYRLETS